MSDLTMFHGPNAGYVLELYERFQQDPQSVDAATRAVFEQWTPTDEPAPQPAASQPQPAAAQPTAPVVQTSGVAPAQAPASYDLTRVVGAARLIRYVRELGHLNAQIDPLGSPPPGDPGLDPANHGVDDALLASLPASIVRGPLAKDAANALEAFQKLQAAYAGPIGYETDHIQTFEERAWLRDVIESGRFFYSLDTPQKKRDLLERLTEVETFERYLHTTFQGGKRFSLEGCDMLVPMLDSIIRNAAANGTHEVVLGMAHRGRLNVLAHTLGKPYDAILNEFLHSANRSEGTSPSGRGTVGWAGDVKYHLGYRRAFKESGIESMPITLAPNPSHLEFVNPVVQGRARAAQEQCDQPGAPAQNEKASLAVLIHGDAAFPGQGVVAETLNMSRLSGYRTGGTIHIITNNQVGFTTDPSDARSTLYSSDLAKGFEVPIIHVNADDVDACIAAARLALAYREQFGKDFVIDLVGYRRWGHNEGDPPSFTQPLMYAKIANHPTVRELWASKLAAEGVVSADEAAQMIASMTTRLQEAKSKAEHDEHVGERPAPAEPGLARRTQTAVQADKLLEMNAALLDRPEGFTVDSRLEKILERRRAALQEGTIDWAHAETLAFASILADGTPVRLSGQDSERGTFVQRHLVLHDANTGKSFTALQALPQAKASFAVYNSPLSETGVLGFEYGYSSHVPTTLVLWEAQFGDFANGAQVIIDQFIVSGRSKWHQLPALVLLLPHGYEGQGPEHSSARLERFLQLAADDNIRVANCTSAAQYFHLLRRQAALLTTDPRPLVVMTPKSLLRHAKAASTLAELAEGQFQRVIDDPTGPERAKHVTRLVLCTGKVYVDLIASPDVEAARDVAVARVEELYSFPDKELRAVIDGYPNLREVVWMQEEPKNMGAWSYMLPRLQELLSDAVPLLYVGRAESSTPAEGSLVEHAVEQARIIKAALSTEDSGAPVNVTVSQQVDG